MSSLSNRNTDNTRSETSSAYITTFEILTTEEAISISVELANKAYIYLFTALEFIMEFAIKPYIKADLFTYNTAITTASRYTLTVFMGIIIDTGTLYKSIANYG